MTKRATQPYVPKVQHTKKSWQKHIRETRRNIYNNMPVGERKQFLQEIFNNRAKGDYQRYKFYKKLYPTFFLED